MNERIELKKLLADSRDEVLVYVPMPGNAGDSLITHSTYQFFTQENVRFEVGHYTHTYPNRIVIYSGGGNLVPLYHEAIDSIARNHSVCKKLIVLPHTIHAYAEVLSTLGDNCFIFCREKKSYAFTQQHARGAHVLLDHDMAFSLDIPRTRREALALRQSWTFMRDNFRRELKLFLVSRRHFARTHFSYRLLNAMRGDAEQTASSLPQNNFDLTDIFFSNDFSPPSCLNTSGKLIDFLDRYESIRTNRLHVGILAALLGKRVLFHSNSYFKNKAVYEYSLQEKFPDVEWQEE